MKTSILTVITTLIAVLSSSHGLTQSTSKSFTRSDSAQQLAELIRSRPANEGRVGNMHFTLRNSSGSERKRSALLIHSEQHEQIKIAIFFTSPAALQDTVFLSHDYALQEDENWLYLPATKRVRRIPSANRGDYFMGTDLTYGDIKDDFKFSSDDWDFSLGEVPTDIPKNQRDLLGVAKSEEKKQELGYGSFYAVIDLNSYFPVELRYTDIDGKPLKEVFVLKQAKIGSAWTAMQFVVRQLQLSHQTEIILEDMRYMPNLPDSLLSADEISYGVPQF
jgi:hypothetical protein